MRVLTLFFIGAALLAGATLGCSPAGGPRPDYKNPARGFAIVFPQNWEIREKQLDLDVAGLSPLEGPDDPFRENVTVASSAMAAPIAADAILDGNIPAMIKAIPGFQPQERGRADLGGIPAAWLRYTQTQDESRLTVVLYAVPGKKHGYLIHCTSETGAWDQFQPRCEEVVKSFKVIE